MSRKHYAPKDQVLQVYVDKDERAIIEAFAREKNIPVSQYLRELPWEHQKALLQYRAED